MKKKLASLLLGIITIVNLSAASCVYAEDYQSANYTIQRDDASWSDGSGLKLLQYYDRVELDPVNDNFININALIKQKSNEFLSSANDNISFIQENPSPFGDYYVNLINSQVTTNSNGILSIKTSLEWFMGGVNSYEDGGLNYDLNTGNVLSLTEVFPWSEKEIAEYFKNQTKQYIAANPNNGWWDDVYKTLDSYALDNFGYYIENDNIYLCYPPYVLGPGAMGAVTVACPIVHKITVKLNGSKLSFDQQPVIVAERTLVPLRAIFEALGANVSWDGNNGIITSTKGSTTIIMTINSSEMRKNNETIYLDVPAMLVNDYTMVPVRAVSEAFGAKVDWDGNSSTVYIDTL